MWLRDAGRHGWAAIGRDTKIFERPKERQAYLDARIHLFLFPGQATRGELQELLYRHLGEICTQCTLRAPAAFLVGPSGLRPV